MTSGQNVKADIAFVVCPCGFDGITETFTDYEAHDLTWECPECERTYTRNLEGENN